MALNVPGPNAFRPRQTRKWSDRCHKHSRTLASDHQHFQTICWKTELHYGWVVKVFYINSMLCLLTHAHYLRVRGYEHMVWIFTITLWCIIFSKCLLMFLLVCAQRWITHQKNKTHQSLHRNDIFRLPHLTIFSQCSVISWLTEEITMTADVSIHCA